MSSDHVKSQPHANKKRSTRQAAVQGYATESCRVWWNPAVSNLCVCLNVLQSFPSSAAMLPASRSIHLKHNPQTVQAVPDPYKKLHTYTKHMVSKNNQWFASRPVIFFETIHFSLKSYRNNTVFCHTQNNHSPNTRIAWSFCYI